MPLNRTGTEIVQMPKQRGFTRVESAMTVIRQKIVAAPGARLPSIRRLAESQGVSKATIVEAYDRLVAEGSVKARPGSGFFAAARATPFNLAETGPQLGRAIDPLWVMRQSMASPNSTMRPGCGWLPDDWLPQDTLRSIVRGIARQQSANLTGYSVPQGFAPLRDQLARRLVDREINADPKNILLTDSATRSIDIVCRYLLREGDTVLVDDPCYFNFQTTLQAQRVKIVGVPYTPSGPDLELFGAACTQHRPKLYLTNAILHNPTGASASVGTAHKLLKLAEAHDLILVEDNIYGDLEVKPSLGLASLDAFERVILLGSFSKTLSAALRCGFIAAKPEWIEGLTDLALATSFGANDLAAQITYRLLIDGSYRRHIDGLKPRLARAMAATASNLERIGFELWTRPAAGMFVWARLPNELSSSVIASKALKRGLVLAPGNVFSVSHSADNYMRFNVSQCGDKAIFDALGELLHVDGSPPPRSKSQ